LLQDLITSAVNPTAVAANDDYYDHDDSKSNAKGNNNMFDVHDDLDVC
jgi:hypothetical protein